MKQLRLWPSLVCTLDYQRRPVKDTLWNRISNVYYTKLSQKFSVGSKEVSKRLVYCKTLIFRVTLFSRAHDCGFIHETLFSRLFISCTVILTWEILAWTLFSRVTGLTNLRENKVLANKKCFTVACDICNSVTIDLQNFRVKLQNTSETSRKSTLLGNVRWESRFITNQSGEIRNRQFKVILFVVNHEYNAQSVKKRHRFALGQLMIHRVHHPHVLLSMVIKSHTL